MPVGKLHRWIIHGLQLILMAAAIVALLSSQWSSAIISLLALLTLFFPLLLELKFRIYIPAWLQLFAAGLVFASLFLGEVRDYYTRFWWWDFKLHALSGFLMAIVGFLLLLNQDARNRVYAPVKPGVAAFTAFMFALGMGVSWEIFEFTIDSVFGTQMQKPMMGDPSGLTDTMWDMIMNAVGAFTVLLLGWRYLENSRRESFLERWIDTFMASNPRLFHK